MKINNKIRALGISLIAGHIIFVNSQDCFAKNPSMAVLGYQEIHDPIYRNVRETFNLYYGKNAEKLLDSSSNSSSYLKTPGVSQNLTHATNRNNPQLRKGALRTHIYAQEISKSPDVTLISVNQIQRPIGELGKTDKDIVFKDKVSGIETRLEVKEVKASTINKNSSKYKLQIDKMAAEQTRNGQRQTWINRKATTTWLKDYAQNKGVNVYDNVITGKGKGTPFNQVILAETELAKRLPNAKAMSKLISPATSVMCAPLPSVSKYASRFGPALCLAGVGYSFYLFKNGQISQEQLTDSTIVAGVGVGTGIATEMAAVAVTPASMAAGMTAGAATGAVIGSIIPGVGTVVGGTIGGIIGGIMGVAAPQVAAGAVSAGATELATQKLQQERDKQEMQRQMVQKEKERNLQAKQDAREREFETAIYKQYGIIH
ncbi:MAG: hypothetical protein WCK17_02210 [Verrucomicrobiota bacterium]